MSSPFPLPPQPMNGRPRVAWPVNMWPSADRDAWTRAQHPGTLLDDAGLAAEWRPATCKSAVGVNGRWLAFLAARGELDMDSGPADRVTPDVVNAYVAYLRSTCGSVTVASYIGVFSMMIQALAPEGDWDWLRKRQAGLQRIAKPSRNKRARIVPIEELLRLGLDLAVRADAEVSTDKLAIAKAARDFRDGFMIALLAMRPLRQGNFLSIRIGQHLVQTRTGYLLRFSADEGKNHRPLEVAFPASLEPILARYLSHWRPLLLGMNGGYDDRYPVREPGARLWIAQTGMPLTAGTLKKALERHTGPQFGHVVNTHLFRACVATSVAHNDPEHVRICAQLLGHSHFGTTEHYYIIANTRAAADRYHDLIESHRRNADTDKKRINQRTGR